MNVENPDEKNIYEETYIIRDATALSGTLYSSQILYIIRGFIIARLLSPSFYGIWSILRSFFGSATYLGFGTQQAMLREVPFSVGEGNKGKKSVITQTSLSWNIITSSIVMILVFIFSFTGFASGYETEIRLSGILYLLNAVHLFMRPKFKSEQKILLLSKYLFYYAVLNTAFGVILLFFFKLSGLLLGMIIAQILILTYLIINGHLSLNLFIDKKILKELFRIGLPIMILWFLIFLIANVDKFIVFILLGKTNAGYYGLAAFVSSMVSYISYSISTVIFPRMMYVYGKTGERKHIEKYFTKPIFILSGIIPVILGIIYINIKAIINFLLPKYMPGITVMHILIAALFFSTIWGLPTNLLIALNKQKKFMYITALLLCIDIILDLILIKMGHGITAIAIVTTFIFFLASALANGYALFTLKKNIPEIMLNLVKIYWPFVYSFAGMFFIIAFSFSNQIILDNLFKSLLFLVFNIPLIFYIEKKSKILSKVFSSFKKS